MDISSKTFHRLFSFSMNKNYKLPLGALSFTKDITNIERGDIYPVVSKSDDLIDAVENNTYIVKKTLKNVNIFTKEFYKVFNFKTNFILLFNHILKKHA